MARKKIELSQVSLELARGQLAIRQPLAEAMKNKTLASSIKARARRHVKDLERFDVKKMQAGDND